MHIQPYEPKYEQAVIKLWERCNLTRPVNEPRKDIQRKLKVDPELFLVGILDGKVVATVMGGYEGHRGAVNYLGVDPDYQKQGLGRQMMHAIEEKLFKLGCPKINLMFRTDNAGVEKFYEKLGYTRDAVIEMGKRLIHD
jgi:ribosomal protein S18 acetylase RimI-like enzyme